MFVIIDNTQAAFLIFPEDGSPATHAMSQRNATQFPADEDNPDVSTKAKEAAEGAGLTDFRIQKLQFA